MTDIFHGFELLLFKTFQANPELWNEWKSKLREKVGEKGNTIEDFDDFGEIPQSLYFLSVALHRRQKYVLQLIHDETEREKSGRLRRVNESLLSTYMSYHQFTELHLDSIFKYGDDTTLPGEIFKCASVTYLSLKYNSLDYLPPDIGRMANLESLALTNNKLQVQSISYTLLFLRKLRTILLDNNLLDALPGYMLKMSSIDTVHRHGNHNYFKATFMWYHTDVNYRIIPIGPWPSAPAQREQIQSLQYWAAKSIIGAKHNFYSDPAVAEVLKDYISSIYDSFRVCFFCDRACRPSWSKGYKVITFKNPYLGNTCVPFQHWVCSHKCAQGLETPARNEQINAARQLDMKYENYIQRCQRDFNDTAGSVNLCVCNTASVTLTNSEMSVDGNSQKCQCAIM